MTLGHAHALRLRYVQESLPMSAVTSFPRPALKRQAFVVVVLFALSICLIWVGYRVAAALEGSMPLPSPWQMVLAAAVVTGFILWKASGRPKAEVRTWIKLRILWRRRRWVALFGFPFAIMFFSMGLGVACSAGYWFSEPPDRAAQYSLAFAALFGVAGFFGGFSLHLPGADGHSAAQR
jgi:hypothetical protein